jgi:dipeptidyl-peptidase-4
MSESHAKAPGSSGPKAGRRWPTLSPRVLLLVLACAAVEDSSPARSGPKVVCANFELAAQWTVEKQMQRTSLLWPVPHWIPGRDAFGYKYATEDEIRYELIDPVAGSRTEAFDRRRLASLLAEELGSRVDWRHLDLREVTVTDGGKSLEFCAGDERFSYNLALQTLSRAQRVPDAAVGEQASYSPDGQRSVFVSDCNLFLIGKDRPSESAIRVTSDGEEYNCVTSQVAWSPDSRSFALVREDWRSVEDLWLINPLANPRPTLETFKWPMPGECVEQYSLWVYRCAENDLVRVSADRWIDQTILQVQWAPDSESLYFLRLSRDWLSLDLCRADPATGECETLIEERGHRQLYYRLPYYLLSTGEILWWSMREGWGHYYLYDRNGNLGSRVTQGSYHSGDVIRIDEADRTLYFMACGREEGRNPYYHHLYKVGLDRGDPELLTPEDAEHEIYMSDSGRYFVDTFSRADLEPHAVVRDTVGRLVMELGAADIGPLVDAGWQKPEIFRVKAADGKTDMWGVMFKPFDFDSTKRYPVISYGYPGKESEFIPWRFSHNRWVTLVSTSLAQYGFVVVVSGNRGGCPERSLAYYDFGADNLRDYPIADKRVVIEQLAERHRFIDLDRVGVMGQSSGGLMAATAILLEPDFFKVAVAKSGNHDNNVYYHHWNERYGHVRQYQDDTGRTTFESRTRTNNEIAGNLKGRLLLVHGDMDRYVPPSQTARLAYDLIKANKRFDMFIVPGGDHFFGENWQYLIRRIELYFVEHLMGDETWSADIFDQT